MTNYVFGFWSTSYQIFRTYEYPILIVGDVEECETDSCVRELHNYNLNASLDSLLTVSIYKSQIINLQRKVKLALPALFFKNRTHFGFIPCSNYLTSMGLLLIFCSLIFLYRVLLWKCEELM